MKPLNQLSLIGLAWICIATTTVGQPCVNGISTNPLNPVNNQFIPMAETWYPNFAPYTANPWLNSFNWYWPTGIKIYKHQVNWDHGWAENPAIADMINPYDDTMPEGFEYLRPNGVGTENRDYRWEDGWELLYMNLGYYPDLNHLNDPAPGSYYYNVPPPSGPLHYDPRPSRAPYFVIYNRYRGLMRVVANVWYEAEATFNDIDVVLRFTDDSKFNSKLTGLLRHASAYDKALSEPTDIWEIHAPRFHAPDLNEWIVADFQIGYDPCSCMSTGELIMDFNAFSTMSVDIIGRSISVDVPITELDYRTKDFLNLSAVNTQNYEPGTEIYRSMDALKASYEARQTKYLNDLNTYNLISPLRMALEVVGKDAVGKYLASGITNIVLTEDLYKWILLPATSWQEELILGSPGPPASFQFGETLTQVLDTTIVRAFTDKAKREIARVFGNLSSEIFKAALPNKPIPPGIPAATLEESVYKGEIGVFAPLSSSPLILPGSLPQAWEPNTSLSPHRIPVYNEVLGQVALLNSPKAMTRKEISVDLTENLQEWGFSRTLEIRVDTDLHFALNPALDFDLSQSASYAMLEIKYQEGNFHTIPDDIDTLHSTSNMRLSQTSHGPYGDMLHSTYSSNWFPMNELTNRVYKVSDAYGLSYGGTNSSVVKAFTPVLLSIKLRVMHDFYFDQIGTSEEQINTLNVYTYLIYQKDGVNHLQTDGPWSSGQSGYFDLYIPGLITLGNETITTAHPHVHHVDGNEIVINAQEVLINGPLQVQPGYIVVIQAFEKIRQAPGAAINPKIRMRIKKDFYDTPFFEYADDATIASFCNGNAYQANTASKAMRERLEQQMTAQAVVEKSKTNQHPTTLSLYPNPARSELTVQSQGAGIDRLHIYDTSGRPVLQATPGGQTLHRLNIGALAPGVYIVRATCGDEVLTEKLVVAR